MCDPRPQREQKRPQTVPVKTQSGLGRSQSLEKRQWASGSSFPTSRLCCGPEPQAARTALFRPHSRGGGGDSRTAGEPSAVAAGDTATRNQNVKTEQCGPGHPAGHGQSQPPAIARPVHETRENFPTAHQLLETRSGLATQTCPFTSGGSRTRSGPERGPRRARQRALRARLALAGQIPQPGAGLSRKEN